MWFVIAVLVALVAAALAARATYDPKRQMFAIGAVLTAFAKWAVGGMAVAFVLSAVALIQAGQRGVVFDVFRGVEKTPKGEGIRVVIPFMQTITVMDVRVQKVEFDASAASQDMQEVATKVTLNYRPNPEMVAVLYQTVGLGYVERVIHPAVQEAVKACTAKHKVEELITKREEVKDEIHRQLAAILSKQNIILVETYITDFNFSRSFSEAIEQKQVAEQEALKARRVLERVKAEAEQKIASARAEAESLRMQQSAITPLLLQLRQIEMQTKAVEKWDGKMPTFIMGNNGALPFINIPVPKGMGN